MNRSQLRRLAKDHAAGRLESSEYLRERAGLIDAIVAGELDIESSPHDTADFAAVAPPERQSRAISLPLIVGACVVVGIIWAFIASRETVAPGIGERSAAGQLPAKHGSSARTLVEDFISTRDWSGQSLAQFRENWNALTPNEQAEARSASWFRRLAEALREEINAHKALAEFDGSGRSSTTGSRLAAFSEYLGIDSEIAPAPTAEQLHTIPAREDDALTGSQWLDMQNGENFTLVLFAVNHLDQIERLTANHADLPLHLLTFEGQLPRFRLVHGSFADQEQARLAHQSLPAAVRDFAPEPSVRRISELRNQLHRGQAERPAMIVDAPAAYTLQLFASSDRENVDRLMTRYPKLSLRVHVSSGDVTPYRVLYGEFDSLQAAREASAQLPATMLEEVGKPLVRESSEFP